MLPYSIKLPFTPQELRVEVVKSSIWLLHCMEFFSKYSIMMKLVEHCRSSALPGLSTRTPSEHPVHPLVAVGPISVAVSPPQRPSGCCTCLPSPASAPYAQQPATQTLQKNPTSQNARTMGSGKKLTHQGSKTPSLRQMHPQRCGWG